MRSWLVAKLLPGLLFLCLPLQVVALEQLTLQLKWTHSFQFAGYYAAKKMGYYRDAGLEVNIIAAAPDTDPVKRVLAGEAQYGVGTSNLLLERANGKPVVALAVIFQQSPYEIYAAPNIRSLKDLEGRRIMLEPQADELLAYLKKEGVDMERVEKVPHSFIPKDLMQGKVDAISGYLTNEPYSFKQAQYPYQTFNPLSAEIDFYGDNLFTSEQELRDHPKRVKAFRDASLRGWQYAKDHRNEVIAMIMTKYASKQSREELRFESDQMIRLLQPNLIEIGYMNPSRWRNIANTYADLGLMPHDFPLKGFLYDASEPDLSWLYQVLVGALVLMLLIIAIALYIHRVNLKLHAAKAIADQALADQRQFIAMIAHEFRSPLAVIDYAAQFLSIKQTPDSDTLPIVTSIRRGVSRLTHFLDNCLTEDRLDSDGMKVHPSSIELGQFALEVKESARHISGRHPLAAEIQARLPALYGDPQLLRIMLLNLLGNAIKYSPDSSQIILRLYLNGRDYVFEVEDFGSGIPADELPLIFQKYKRGRTTSDIPGAGLGLSLVARIVSLHHGKIEVKSTAGKGSKFIVTLPMRSAPAEQQGLLT